MTYGEIEKLWNEQTPQCMTCGYCAIFYEIMDSLEETRPGEYHAVCVSKDCEDSYLHKGAYCYDFPVFNNYLNSIESGIRF